MTLNSDEIQAILPHRYPFLFIDRITTVEPGTKATAIKNVSVNEEFFCGHFPGKSVMSGVLILEAMAQTGAVAILMEEENKGKLAYFGGVRHARFKRQVVPGDQLELCCEIVTKKGNIGIGKGTAMVDGKVVAFAELTFAIG